MRYSACVREQIHTGRLYRAFLRSDAGLDGRVWVAVRTTGIYCLPSCRARKPKLQNVRFYASRTEAERGGFRPCRKCRPDVTGGRAAMEKAALQRWMAMLAEGSAPFRELARQGGASPSRLYRLFRRHTGHGPRQARAQVRLSRACAALRLGSGTVTDAAYAAGFESLATFYRWFRRQIGMTPMAYRREHEQGAIV